MIMRGANLFSRAAAYLTILFAMTACGGGGGGGAGFLGPSGGGDGDLILNLLDPQGNATNTVTESSPGTVKVSVGGSDENVVVNLTTTIGTVFPESGNALTDSEGVATFQIEAGDVRGGGTLNATAEVNGDSLTGSLPFQVGATGLRLGRFDNGGTFIENEVNIEPAGTLSAGGSAELSVVILDANDKRVTTGEDVRFNSGCIGAALATINPESPVQSINGEASTLYTVSGCTGVDEITASLVGAGGQAFGSVNVASPSAHSLLFVDAAPRLIVLRGTGGQNRTEITSVTFRVVDSSGLPLQGVSVDFGLTTDVGGITLGTSSGLTNGEGEVTVTVQSGDVATTLRVLASIDDGSGNIISTVSDLVTVTTGLPDQDSISLSISAHIISEAWNKDGKTATLTVRMSDKFNNPVVDGTAAVFTTEYGSIVGSCTTIAGACSVEWNSQEPRLPLLTGNEFVKTIFDVDYDCPSHNGDGGPCPDDLGWVRGGRSEILVHAIGEESFVDRNGNGIMDREERDLFDNLPEAFIDFNEDGIWTPALPECAGNSSLLQCIAGQEERFVDYNSSDSYDFNDDPALFNGLLCPPKGDDVWCSRDLVHVWDSNIVVLSDDPNFFLNVVDRSTRNVVNSLRWGRSYDIYIADQNNNPPPGDSTVTLAASGDCVVPPPLTTDIFDTAAPGAWEWGMFVAAPTELSGEPGRVTVTLETPAVNITWGLSCEPGAGFDVCDFSPQPPGCDDP